METLRIVNQKQLLSNAVFDEDSKARGAALKILRSALKSSDPRIAIKNHVHREGNILSVNNLVFDLEKFQQVFVVGGGKASGAMAEALEDILGDDLTEGFVNVLRGTKSNFKTRKIFLKEAGHPIHACMHLATKNPPSLH